MPAVSGRAEAMPEKDPKAAAAAARESAKVVLPCRLESRILRIRSRQVMLDADLARLYEVETRVLIQAVKRNYERFPTDFMFQLTRDELERWRSQIVISNPAARKGLRRRPYAFTEHGILMLSSVLRSPRAVQVNIEIMRTFLRLRRMVATHEALGRKLAELEARYDGKFRVVFETLRRLLRPQDESGRQIGFRRPRR